MEVEEELFYQSWKHYIRPEMEEDWFIKPSEQQEWRTFGLTGVFWTKDEEELVYHSSGRWKIRKTCSSRPLKDSWRRTALPNLEDTGSHHPMLYFQDIVQRSLWKQEAHARKPVDQAMCMGLPEEGKTDAYSWAYNEWNDRGCDCITGLPYG